MAGGSPVPLDAVHVLVDHLVMRADERGQSCVDLSDLSDLIQERELEDEDAQLLHELLAERGFELRDDCGRDRVEQTSYINGNLASQTTDAMALFLQEVRRYPLLTREQEVD